MINLNLLICRYNVVAIQIYQHHNELIYLSHHYLISSLNTSQNISYIIIIVNVYYIYLTSNDLEKVKSLF
jgi:hypothetical protein